MLTYSDYFLTLFVVLAFALADTKKIILCDVEKPEREWHIHPLRQTCLRCYTKETWEYPEVEKAKANRTVKKKPFYFEALISFKKQHLISLLYAPSLKT